MERMGAMERGQFCFISDSFYEKYDQEHQLMRNKEKTEGLVHERPCFFAFPDQKNENVFWCIPISSKVDKFRGIYESKIEKQHKKGIKNPVCNTIRFGRVLGQERTFLIQNMFPIIEKYITSIYIDVNTKNPVTISKATEKEIMKYARDVLKLTLRGNSNILFSDVVSTYRELVVELDHAVVITPKRMSLAELDQQVVKERNNMDSMQDKSKNRSSFDHQR